MKLQCVWKLATILNLQWEMCLYAREDDRFVSGSIHTKGQWEGSMVTHMITMMRAHPNSTLLDIGGNIGYYALAAAAAKFDVHVFEPVPTNAAMIQQSIAKNRFETIRLHTTALGHRVEEFGMSSSRTHNQGGVRHNARVKSRTLLPALELDRVLSPETRPVYIKMDIEGGECNAVRGMKAYLAGSAQIIGVNMEFGQCRAACCDEWVRPGGFFHVLHERHRLCPRGVAYETICNSSAWDLVWNPCPKNMA